MNQQVKFKKTTNFKGRNGVGYCKGIDFVSATVVVKEELIEVVVLSPLCSKGVTSTFIDIPIDSIRELIQALIKFSPEIIRLDTTEQDFLDWLDNSECPHCSTKGKVIPFSHSTGRCNVCEKEIDLIEWKVRK